MSPFRVAPTGGTEIGAKWIEQQRAESCRGHGTGEGGQLAAERGGGVAGAEIYLRQTFLTMGSYVARAFSSGLDQARGEPHQWGGGLPGYGS